MLIPVEKPHRVTSGYGWRVLNGEKQFHNGIDFISRTGLTDVFAVLDGQVVYDMDNYDHSQRWTSSEHSAGNYIIIKHYINGKYYYSKYVHLEYNRYKVGDEVKRGEFIGVYGDYGRSYGAHLHFSLYNQEWNYIDPTTWFKNLY